MLSHPDLSWPLCLGTFDEESCRYFLYEIGQSIVPNFPFSFGMEEVYGKILERYGTEGIADVISLLQELLEDDLNASGLGDDGDVWRSWRHSWRHRNVSLGWCVQAESKNDQDDTLNPFVPRFGPLILQPPTPSRIRRLKAHNFALQAESTVECMECVERIQPLEKDDLQRIPHQFSNSRTERANLNGSQGLLSLRGHSEAPTGSDDHAPPKKSTRSIDGNDLSKKFGHNRSASANSISLACSNISGEGNSSSAVLAQLRGGEKCYKRPQRMVPNMQNTQGDPEEKSLPRSTTASSSVPQEVTESRSEDGLHTPIRYRRSLRWVQNLRKTGTTTDGDSASGLVLCKGSKQAEVTEVVARPTRNHNSGELQPISIADHRERATNRQARLIDGTIFTPLTRRAKTVSQIQPNTSTISEKENKRPSSRLSWSPLKRRDSLRGNWVQDLRQLFHGGRQVGLNSPHKGPPPASQPLNTSMAGDQPRGQSPTSISLPPTSNYLGLDGVTDELQPAHSLSVDLNKPLPLSPEDIVKTMSSRSQLVSSQYSDNFFNLPSTASTASSISRSSSKKQFRGAALDLSQSETLAQHELPPICEVESDNKHRFEPQKASVMPRSPVSYTSVAQGNPFSDQEQHNLHTIALTPAPNNVSHKCDTAMPASPVSGPQSIFNHVVPAPKKSDDSPSSSLRFGAIIHNQRNKATSLMRGREEPLQGPSTTTQQQDLPPKTPTKRSRSPIKRILGLTKSHSTNKFDESKMSVGPPTPSGLKPDSLKRLGDKIRFGFLAADQDQLRQEELIEAHHCLSTDSTPPRSTFPVSLEPPVQAKIQSEMELILAVTANRYLLHEAESNRISAESVAKVRELWEKRNRPQVIEFLYDLLTQHHLVMSNLDRVKLHGDAAKDAIAINSTMRGWKTLAQEISIRTFCSPDSVIRKHLHDAHRVLELLGAPFVTFTAFEDMQLKTLEKISQCQKERMERKGSSANRKASENSNMATPTHGRSASDGNHQQSRSCDRYDIPSQAGKLSSPPSQSPTSKKAVRKATGAEGAIMSLPVNFERSRDGYVSALKNAKIGLNIKEI